jgi:hypothetical protein
MALELEDVSLAFYPNRSATAAVEENTQTTMTTNNYN